METLTKTRIIQGDCLDIMEQLIKEGVRVDSIITDPPYGTTACKWDSVIAFDKMWECLNKLIKDNGAICLFGKEPFSSHLRLSNIKNYKYDWIWQKERGCNFANANKQPMDNIENILCFYRGRCPYYPIMREVKPYKHKLPTKQSSSNIFTCCKTNPENTYKSYDKAYPTKILYFARDMKNRLHPTQKPVALLEYLIKTYTKEGDTVLDFTMGSGTTGVACKNLNRNFIGIELDLNYFKVAEERINKIMETKNNALI